MLVYLWMKSISCFVRPEHFSSLRGYFYLIISLRENVNSYKKKHFTHRCRMAWHISVQLNAMTKYRRRHRQLGDENSRNFIETNECLYGLYIAWIINFNFSGFSCIQCVHNSLCNGMDQFAFYPIHLHMFGTGLMI